MSSISSTITQGPANVLTDASHPVHQGLAAPVWRGWVFKDHGILLHVPSCAVFQVDPKIVHGLPTSGSRGSSSGHSPEEQAAVDATLAHLIGSLPADQGRTKPKVDIQSVSLNVAQNCNLRCTYCFAGDGDYGKSSLMTHEVATRAIEQLSSGKSSFHIIFFGGEPLLNFKLMESVVAWCRTRPDTKFTFSLTTNGTLLSEKHAAFFKEHGFFVNISYDGAGLHARQRLNTDRKSNSEGHVQAKLERFEEALKTLRSVQLRTTVSKENLDVLGPAIIATLNSYSYQLMVGYHATPIRSLAFTEEDVAKMGDILEDVVNELLEKGDYATLMRLEPIRSHVAKIHRGKGNQSYCAAAVNYVSVSTEGKYYACHRFTEDGKGELGSIEAGLDAARTDFFTSHRRGDHAPCNTCWMRQWCGGGCFHENQAALNSPFLPDPMFCKMQDREMTLAMRVYNTLLNESPDHVPGQRKQARHYP